MRKTLIFIITITLFLQTTGLSYQYTSKNSDTISVPSIFAMQNKNKRRKACKVLEEQFTELVKDKSITYVELWSMFDDITHSYSEELILELVENMVRIEYGQISEKLGISDFDDIEESLKEAFIKFGLDGIEELISKAGDSFFFGDFSVLIDAFTDTEELDIADFWPDVVRLGIRAGENAGCLFGDILPQAIGKGLVEDPSDLNSLGNQFIKLIEKAGKATATGLITNEFSMLKEVLGEDTKFAPWLSCLVELGIDASENANDLFNYVLPAAIEAGLVKDSKDLRDVGKQLIKLMNDTKSSNINVSLAAPVFYSIQKEGSIKTFNDLKNVWDKLIVLYKGLDKNAVYVFGRILPMLIQIKLIKSPDDLSIVENQLIPLMKVIGRNETACLYMAEIIKLLPKELLQNVKIQLSEMLDNSQIHKQELLKNLKELIKQKKITSDNIKEYLEIGVLLKQDAWVYFSNLNKKRDIVENQRATLEFLRACEDKNLTKHDFVQAMVSLFGEAFGSKEQWEQLWSDDKSERKRRLRILKKVLLGQLEAKNMEELVNMITRQININGFVKLVISKIKTLDITSESKGECFSLEQEIAKIFPAFREIIGKKQHGTHEWPLDIHTLKVMQGIVTNPNFEKLSFEHQKTVLLAGLFHDIAKGANQKQPAPDPDHCVNSYHKATEMLNQARLLGADLPQEVINDILTLVLFHDWEQLIRELIIKNGKLIEILGLKSNYTYAQILAGALRGHLWDLMQILEQADMKGVGNGFWESHKDEYEARRIEIETKVKANRMGQLWIPQTKISIPTSNASLKIIDLRTMHGLKALNLLDRLELNVFVHAKKDVSSGLTDMVSSLHTNILNSLISVSYWAQGVFNTFRNSKFGLIFKVMNQNIIRGSRENIESGYKKGFPQLLENIGSRPALLDELKTKLGIEGNEEVFLNFMEKISTYEDLSDIPNQEQFNVGEIVIRGEQVKPLLLEFIEENFLNPGDNPYNNHNEFLIMCPESTGIFYAADDNTKGIEEVPENFKALARTMGIPIIIVSKYSPIVRKTMAEVLKIIRSEKFKDFSFEQLYSMKWAA
ncbi:hypothetical protein ACFL4A_03080 [bacterium]